MAATAQRVAAAQGGVARRAAAPRVARTPVRVLRSERQPRARPRFTGVIAVGLLVSSLFAVVLGHALLAQQQVRLSAAQAQLAQEQTRHRQDDLNLAQLETPSRIVAAAQQLHMVRVNSITQLPYVSLSTAVPAPHVLPDPKPAGTSPSTGTPATSSSTTAPTSTSTSSP